TLPRGHSSEVGRACPRPLDATACYARRYACVGLRRRLVMSESRTCGKSATAHGATLAFSFCLSSQWRKPSCRLGLRALRRSLSLMSSPCRRPAAIQQPISLPFRLRSPRRRRGRAMQPKGADGLSAKVEVVLAPGTYRLCPDGGTPAAWGAGKFCLRLNGWEN